MFTTLNEIILGLYYDKQLLRWSHLHLRILPIFCRKCINILQAFFCIQGKKANGGQWDRKSYKPVIMGSSTKIAVDNKYG